MTNREYNMRKEWKLDALICVLALRNPEIHFNLSNLYMYIRRDNIMTEEEIQTFDELFRKISRSSLEDKIRNEVFEDDERWNNYE